jgi:hypothetical protein
MFGLDAALTTSEQERRDLNHPERGNRDAVRIVVEAGTAASRPRPCRPLAPAQYRQTHNHRTRSPSIIRPAT